MNGLAIIFLLIASGECLKLYHVLVPYYRLENEDAFLECNYDLGNARLYAVKWYKDNEEFFRYIPRFKPPIKTHLVEGVNVDVSESDSKGVLLTGLDISSTGIYRCEISAEAPYFLTVHGEGRMTVVHLPKEGPQIKGNLQDQYEIGDILDLNCTSSYSFPPAKISWFINDIPVEVTRGLSIQPVTTSSIFKSSLISQRKMLTTSTLCLHLELSSEHFSKRGTINIRCVASISTLFWEDDNEIAVGGSTLNKVISTTTIPNPRHHQHHSYPYKNENILQGRNGENGRGNREYVPFDSFSSSSITSTRHQNQNYYDKPNPFIFNSTTFITVKGITSKITRPCFILGIFTPVVLVFNEV